jgi:hypothetical protein
MIEIIVKKIVDGLQIKKIVETEEVMLFTNENV